MGFNRVILEGRLAKDIEIRYSSTGVAMAKSTIAVSKKFSSNGEQKEKTLFVTIQLWKRSAEIFNQYCRKGGHILVEGELENNDYVDGQGIKKFGYVVNVSSLQMLDTKNNQQQPAQQNHLDYQPQQKMQQRQVSERSLVPEIEIDEDEIPF